MASSTTSTSNPNGKPFHIAIVGGGIGGLCLAIGLLRQSANGKKFSVRLYEAAAAFAEIGAGVSFGPNAIKAMELIDPAIKAGYDKRSTVNGWEEKRETWFDFRLGQEDFAVGGGVQGRDYGYDEQGMRRLSGRVGEHVADVKVGHGVGQNSVHRAHFLDELVKLVPDDVAVFGKRLDGLEERGEKMLLRFQDGTQAEADAVIGCDGIKSKTRTILLGEKHESAHAVFSGRYAYRGLIPMEKAVEAVGEELARNSQMYMGLHGHVLTFPIEKGRTMNVVAFRTKSDGKWEDEKWVLPMKKEDMFEDFKGWGESVKHILSLMEKPDVWALFDHPPAPTFYKRQLCLLGDAAHATTPHQGAGAGQAIEDAYVLSNLIGQVSSSSQLEAAFKAYDAIRRPRSQKVVTTSRDASDVYEFEDKNVGLDLEKAKELLEKRFRWIWDEDLGQQLKKAQDLLVV